MSRSIHRNIVGEEVSNLEADVSDWLVTESGVCQPFPVKNLALPEQPYRLFRFLTELEDILATIPTDRERLSEIVPRVRKLLMSSYWLQLEFSDPPSDPGWSVEFLYEDHEFPLTIQMVAWRPGQVSPIHNHGAWGVVAVVGGSERNRLYRRTPNPQHPDRLTLVEEKTLIPGDIISFLPDAIHSVEPLGEESAITFNLYGKTDFEQRFEFDLSTQTARHF